MSKKTAVFGIYPDRFQAENAVTMLKSAGYRNSDISVLLPDRNGSGGLGHEKGSKAPEGSAVGAGAGAAVGGVLGWLAGVGALSIPGIGPFIAAGPIMGLLAGVSIGGAVGGMTGALIGLGIPEYKAKRYEGMIRAGKVLLSVHCDNPEWESKARRFLEETGANDVSASSESAPPKEEKQRISLAASEF